MSYYPIELDKERTFKFGMKAIDRIEKKFKKPITAIHMEELTMQDYAVLFHAGLMHEDKDLTPDKTMDLIDEHSTIGQASKIMWEAFNESLKTGDEEEEKLEILIKLKAMLDGGIITKEEAIAVVNGEMEVKNG